MIQRRLLVAVAAASLGCAAAPERGGTPGVPPAASADPRAPAAAPVASPQPGALVAAASEHIAQKRFAAAVAELDRAIALRETPQARTLRGRALALDRRFEDAARDLERAVELDPGSVEAWAVLAAVQVNRGDRLEAERAFAAAVARAGAVAAVDRFWTQLLSLAPDPVAPQETLDRCTRGYAAGMHGQWAEAERELRNGLKYAPRYGWCLAQWAESLGHAGDVVRAEAAFRQAIETFAPAQAPLRADTEAQLAALLVATRRNAAEAVALARSALAVRGERAALLLVLARACELASDAGCVRDAYTRVLGLPHLPPAVRASAEERLRSTGTGPSAAAK